MFAKTQGKQLGMILCLLGEYLYTPLRNIKTFWGYQTFLALMVDELCLGKVLLICSWLPILAEENKIPELLENRVEFFVSAGDDERR